MTLLSSGLPEAVGDDEQIARFLTQSSHFSKQQVDPSVFLPGKRDRETSVSRHGREPLETLRALGAAAANGRKLYGAAMFQASDVRAALLSIASSEPPERHAVIRGWAWNDSDPDEQKAKQKECALQLARASKAPLLFNDGQEWSPV
jgi:hypothetical protein